MDSEDEAIITAAAVLGDGQIVAYDADGRYYSIDPVTFERTKISDGFYGKTYPYTFAGMEYGMSYSVVDISYDTSANRLYASLYLSSNAFVLAKQSQLVELDPETGDVMRVISTAGAQGTPANLLVYYGRAYYITSSGFLTTVNLNEGYNVGVPYQYDLTENYWSGHTESRGIVYDEYTDTCYAIRNNIGYASTALQSNFMTFDLNKARPNVFGEIGAGIKVTSLFIL